MHEIPDHIDQTFLLEETLNHRVEGIDAFLSHLSPEETASWVWQTREQDKDKESY